MKKTPSNNILSMIYQRISFLLTVLFCFLLGISVGIFTEILLSAEGREGMESFLNAHLFLSKLPGTDLPYVFLDSAATNLALLLIITLAGLTIIGFPATLLVLLYKGAALGFSAALLIEMYDFKGVLLVLFTLVPQNLILIPAFLAAFIASLSLALSVLASGPRGIKKSLGVSAGNFIAFNILMSVFILGGCFIESFISPFLQRLLG